MAQQGRGAGSHPDEPPPKRRTLQIKLGRPRPPTTPEEQASPSINRGIRISLKRKPSVAESQVTPPRFATLQQRDEEDDDADEDDEDEDAEDEQRLDDGGGSEQDEEDDDDDQDHGQDEGEEQGDGEDGDEEQDDDVNAEGDPNNAAADPSDPTSASRIRGKNGAFKNTSAGGGSNPNRRPIKRLRSKGLYDALPKLIENLQRRDSYKFFCEPVNPDDVPGYSDVIKTPMDFGTMQHKVDHRLYSHMNEFKSDFKLVVDNAMTFNPEGTLYYNEAKRIGTWGTRAIEREGMAVNDNGRAGVKGDEIRRQKRLAREAALASTSAAPAGLEAIANVGEVSGRRQLRGSTQQQHALDEASLQQVVEGQASLGYDAATGDILTRSGARGSHVPFSAGVRAIMEAARSTTQARQRAAIALGLTGGTLTREDSVLPDGGFKAEGEADMDLDDDDEDDGSDAEGIRASVARDSRERSVTVDGPSTAFSRRLGSSQPGGTPSTPMAQRQPSPDALRKRLAAVTGTPIQALASPLGPAAVGGSSRASKNAKHKSRLGAPGTPKRLLARTDFTGPATPIASAAGNGAGTAASGLPLAPAAAAAAAAQLMANVSQTQLQPGMANYSFEDDGSINPDDVDDLHTFLTLHRSDKHVLMPTIESLHPIPFVPGDYVGSGSGAGDKDKDKEQDKDDDKPKGKDKAKEKAVAADDADDDDEDGKGDSREKGDKDPLSSLPPMRPGAPDPLYSAIAPEPEALDSNLSHDVEPLPPHFRNLPFHAPSLFTGRSQSTKEKPGVPASWNNPAYLEALENDKRPKKQKDKEREKERETLEDWSYFRPTLTRLLEITDLGPLGALAPRVEDIIASSKAAQSSIKSGAKGKAAKGGAKQIEAKKVQVTEFSTSLLAEEGIQAVKAELEHRRPGRILPKAILYRYVQAARSGTSKGMLSDAERRDAADILTDMVYAGTAGNAYVRSVGEFVGGAMHHAMLLDEADDAEEQRIAEAEAHLVLAAALRQAKEVEEAPEPTAASRRGPFMWRDTTEEVGGTATPSGDLNCEETAHTTAVATPAMVTEDAKPAMFGLLNELHTAVEELTPLPKPLAEVVEEEVIRPLTGNTVDILHFVAAHLQTAGADSLHIGEIEARLLKNKITPHPVDGVVAAPKASQSKTKTRKSTLAAPSLTPPLPQGSLPAPPPPQSIPFAEELDWLKDQPNLTQLLDEARNDVDSLGSILNYIIQSA